MQGLKSSSPEGEGLKPKEGTINKGLYNQHDIEILSTIVEILHKNYWGNGRIRSPHSIDELLHNLENSNGVKESLHQNAAEKLHQTFMSDLSCALQQDDPISDRIKAQALLTSSLAIDGSDGLMLFIRHRAHDAMSFSHMIWRCMNKILHEGDIDVLKAMFHISDIASAPADVVAVAPASEDDVDLTGRMETID